MRHPDDRSPRVSGPVLRTRLILGFVALLAILLAVGVTSIELLDQLGGAIAVILRENYKSVIACDQMKEALERMDSGALFALAGEEGQGRSLALQHQPRFEQALRTELGNITLPGEGERARKLQQLYGFYGPVLQQILDPGLPVGQRRALYFQKLYPAFQQIKETADEILEMNERNMVKARDHARGIADGATRVMALLLLAGTALAGFAVFFLSWPVLEQLEEESNPGPAVTPTSRDESGQLHLEPVFPRELIEAAVHEAAPDFREEGVKLAVDVSPGAPEVLADRERVRLALAALLKNARAHSSTHSTVTVTAEPWKGHARFSITDDGPGIPAAHLERIFEPFYQVPGTQDLGEVGLGLAIAREVVQSHGGEIHGESEEGHGATFWFTLPAAS